MTVRKSRKVRKQRGSRSHGYGVVKDHKGKGMSGGAGKAGLFSHRWLQAIKEAKKERRKNITGKYGFIRPQQYLKKYPVINVSHLNASVDSLVAQGKATKEGETYVVNLEEMGIKKLLAQGEITKPMKITVAMATEGAISKVEAAGGSVTLLQEED
ncbi:MAG: 50S ribosomal protein L15 [Methanobacteriota archaeon]|nr:MAG: 50S ribosomal protein L15 [Euryarchaeota archaeon]